VLDGRLSIDDPEAILELAADLADRAFARRLVATFVIGSLAHGGFSPSVSDVDLAVVIAGPLTDDDRSTIAGITNGVHTLGGLAERLSVFWSSPAALTGEADPTAGRMPALDRLDLAVHGQVRRGGFDLTTIVRPTTRELVVEATQFAIDKLSTADVVEELGDARALVARGARHLTKRILFPVRFTFTALTHEMGTNEAAAAWYVAGGYPASDLVRHAAAWRTAPLDPAEAEPLVRAGVVDVYDFFLARHIELMDEFGESERAAALRSWRARLSAR
jgi:hypothetical protein